MYLCICADRGLDNNDRGKFWGLLDVQRSKSSIFILMGVGNECNKDLLKSLFYFDTGKR